MTGNLALSSPWARQAFTQAQRTQLRALIPDGFTVGVSVSANHKLYRAWANNDRAEQYALHIVEGRDPVETVLDVIFWLRGVGIDG